MNEQSPLPNSTAWMAEANCVAHTVGLLLARDIHMPKDNVGKRVCFADGTSARVYRETVVDRPRSEEPCVLAVRFRLRAVRGALHTAFRWESLLNTPLFVGFPGFVSKLWFAHDDRDVYRGIYDWDGAERAEHYARSLWRVLVIGCVPSSIKYAVVPGVQRDELLASPALVSDASIGEDTSWFQPVARV